MGFNLIHISVCRLKDLKNAKEKLEAKIIERENTIETLTRKIHGLVSFFIR